MLGTKLPTLLNLAVVSYGASWIVPGAVWTDTDGNKIDAHGGAILQQNSTFYWVGHSAADQTPMMYSSTDLLSWKNLGAQASSVTGLWRPKLATPSGAGSFWIYGQQDRRILSLQPSHLVGGYKTSAKVLLPPSNASYSDTGIFCDEGTAKWYILSSADHNIVQINEINSEGKAGDKVGELTGGLYEAPGLFQVDGVYFLIVSGKTGWRANPNKVFWAASLGGPWSGGTDIAPATPNTYGSQNTFALTIKGSQQTTRMYMGDAWDSTGSTASNYVWLPMDVDSSAKTVTLSYHAMWKVDTATGVVSFPTCTKRFTAEDAKLSGLAKREVCGDCPNQLGPLKVRHDGEVEFRNVTGTGRGQWILVKYSVNRPEVGQMYIRVNNGPKRVNLADLNSRAGHHGDVPVELVLTPGTQNTLQLRVDGHDDFEATVHGIELYD
ncbi:hypothetical protein P8C59_003474 [Phyllachora maydis]|uniref:Arabinanase/levansucrase/invertase n=1 Tax=Phyllachora maydis TaxID=1825666 RepID=A0AAD9I0A8_9PEZI|nr:hypothetical protein P8C59_003474 [Phyllachora maydis]